MSVLHWRLGRCRGVEGARQRQQIFHRGPSENSLPSRCRCTAATAATAAAGYLQYLVYDLSSLGFVPQTFDAIVDGIVLR